MRVYPEGTVPPPQEKPSNPDDDKLAKAQRLAAVEEELVRIWVGIARDEIPRVHKLFNYGFIAKQNMYRRLSSVASGPKGSGRAVKRNDVPMRAKKLVKGVAEYWRRAEREEIEKKKLAEKEAYEKLKKDEENREAQRQAKKLEFLLTQTELYSHFVGNKSKDAGDDDDDGDGDDNEPLVDPTTLDFNTGAYLRFQRQSASSKIWPF